MSNSALVPNANDVITRNCTVDPIKGTLQAVDHPQTRKSFQVTTADDAMPLGLQTKQPVVAWLCRAGPSWIAYPLPPTANRSLSILASQTTLVSLKDLSYGEVDQCYLSKALQRSLRALYAFPAVQLVDGRQPTPFAVCDAGLTRTLNRWNLDVDVIPLCPFGMARDWCQLLRFHNNDSAARFFAQLRRHYHVQRPRLLKELIALVPCKWPQRHVSRQAGQHPERPVFAIDAGNTTVRDDAIQCFETPEALVVRMYVATPFTTAAATTAFASGVDVLDDDKMQQARTRLLRVGTIPLFDGANDYGLSASIPRRAVCYEMQFRQTATDVDPLSLYPTRFQFTLMGSVTTRLVEDVRIHAALTFEQFEAWEDGEIALDEPLAKSLSLLRKLSDALANAKDATDRLDAQRAHTTWVAKMQSLGLCADRFPAPPTRTQDIPRGIYFSVFPECGKNSTVPKFYRTIARVVPRVRSNILGVLQCFQVQQKHKLFETFQFALDELQALTDAQLDDLDALCVELQLPVVRGIVPPDDVFGVVDIYRTVLNWDYLPSLLAHRTQQRLEASIGSLGLLVSSALSAYLVETTAMDALRCSAPADGAYWRAVEASLVPPRGVARCTEVSMAAYRQGEGTAHVERSAFGSSHPLRNYIHLLAQYLMLSASVRTVPPSDAECANLLRHTLAAMQEMSHVRRLVQSADANFVVQYLTDDTLPYRRVVPLTGILLSVGTSEATPDEKVVVQVLIPGLTDNTRPPLTQGSPGFVGSVRVPAMAPMVVAFPTSFGSKLTCVAVAGPRSSRVQLNLVPQGVSLSQAITPDDMWSDMLLWHGAALREQIKRADANLLVSQPVSSDSALVPFLERDA